MSWDGKNLLKNVSTTLRDMKFSREDMRGGNADLYD